MVLRRIIRNNVINIYSFLALSANTNWTVDCILLLEILPETIAIRRKKI